jgi:hypothetical protein
VGRSLLMARIRSVHPDLCVSETMAQVSAEVERTFIRLWIHCDDSGRCVDNPKLLAAQLFPLHDEMDADEVNGHLDELAGRGLIQRYEHDGKRYIAVSSWLTYQKPQRPTPSKFPEPSVELDVPLRESSASPRVRSGVEIGDGEGVEAAAPNSFEPSDASRKWAEEQGFGSLIESETPKFLDWHLSKGRTSYDWQAEWRVWMTRCKSNVKALPADRVPVPPMVSRCEQCGDLSVDCVCAARAGGGTPT